MVSSKQAKFPELLEVSLVVPLRVSADVSVTKSGGCLSFTSKSSFVNLTFHFLAAFCMPALHLSLKTLGMSLVTQCK
jgi:hypothetical protein